MKKLFYTLMLLSGSVCHQSMAQSSSETKKLETALSTSLSWVPTIAGINLGINLFLPRSQRNLSHTLPFSMTVAYATHLIHQGIIALNKPAEQEQTFVPHNAPQHGLIERGATWANDTLSWLPLVPVVNCLVSNVLLDTTPNNRVLFTRHHFASSLLTSLALTVVLRSGYKKIIASYKNFNS